MILNLLAADQAGSIPRVTQQQVQSGNLAPLIHVNKHPAKFPELRMDQIQTVGAHLVERHKNTANGKSRVVTQHSGDDIQQRVLLSGIQPVDDGQLTKIRF